MQVIAIPKGHGRARRLDGAEGFDFVRCRVCGKHLHVISGRHLSTHGTDRETYIEEYALSPDQLCSKTFRVNHSSRSDYCAHSRREWIAAMRAIYKQHGNVYAGFLQKHYPNLYLEGIWLNGGDWDAALLVLGFTPERMRLRTYWHDERVITKILILREKRVPLYPAYILGIDWDSSATNPYTNLKGVGKHPNGQQKTTPLLIISNGAYYFIVPGEIYHDVAYSKDKTYAISEGAVHGGGPCSECTRVILNNPELSTAEANAYWTDPQGNGPLERSFNFMAEWLSFRY